MGCVISYLIELSCGPETDISSMLSGELPTDATVRYRYDMIWPSVCSPKGICLFFFPANHESTGSPKIWQKRVRPRVRDIRDIGRKAWRCALLAGVPACKSSSAFSFGIGKHTSLLLSYLSHLFDQSLRQPCGKKKNKKVTRLITGVYSWQGRNDLQHGGLFPFAVIAKFFFSSIRKTVKWELECSGLSCSVQRKLDD